MKLTVVTAKQSNLSKMSLKWRSGGQKRFLKNFDYEQSEITKRCSEEDHNLLGSKESC